MSLWIFMYAVGLEIFQRHVFSSVIRLMKISSLLMWFMWACERVWARVSVCVCVPLLWNALLLLENDTTSKSSNQQQMKNENVFVYPTISSSLCIYLQMNPLTNQVFDVLPKAHTVFDFNFASFASQSLHFCIVCTGNRHRSLAHSITLLFNKSKYFLHAEQRNFLLHLNSMLGKYLPNYLLIAKIRAFC